jgi:dephospho-CoA kinase
MSGTLLVGLTGGIGSGKSTVAGLLARMGADVIDADALARDVTSTAGAAIPAIRTEFGSEYITREGALDRSRMRELAFRDAGAKRRLEAIVHPLVGQITDQRTLEAVRRSHPCLVFDIPLLVESGHWRSKLHRVVVVDCDEQTQIERVVARNGLPPEVVRRIISSQAPRHTRLSAADIVLSNQDRTMEALSCDVEQLAKSFGLSLRNRN